MFKNNVRGFTLVELIVVITILAILATVGFLALQGYTKDARNSAVRTNLTTIMSTIMNETATAIISPSKFVLGTTNNIDVLEPTLSGATVSSGLTLSQLTTNGNYRAGVPDYSKLKLDGTKFNDNGSSFIMGAASVSEVDPSTKVKRPRLMVEIAGTVDEGAGPKAAVIGNYAKGAGPNDVAGLIWGTGGTAGIILDKGDALPYAY